MHAKHLNELFILSLNLLLIINEFTYLLQIYKSIT